MDKNELLTVTAEIGSLLIEYGAEIYRVEDSINRIIAAYNAGEPEVFAIPSCLIITINDENGCPLTRQKRILHRAPNLDRVDKLNNLSRFICSQKPDYEQITTFIGQIKKRRVYPLPVQLLSHATVGATFAVFFGGGLREATTAAVLSVFANLILYAVQREHSGIFLESVMCSVLVAVPAVLIAATGFTDGYDAVIIGSLMNFVPGIVLTNCMRDFIAGDFLAGLLTMVEALLVAAGMAIGAAAAIALTTAIV